MDTIEMFEKTYKEEFEILKSLRAQGFNYLVRNQMEGLLAFKDKPCVSLYFNDWFCSYENGTKVESENDIFKYIHTTDEEPNEIKNLLVKYYRYRVFDEAWKLFGPVSFEERLNPKIFSKVFELAAEKVAKEIKDVG